MIKKAEKKGKGKKTHGIMFVIECRKLVYAYC